MENYLEFDIFDDDLEILEILDVGIPRGILIRADHFNNLDDRSFFRRFRLTKPTVLQVLDLIEHRLEFPYDRNQCISPINQLLIALRCFATGSHLPTIGDFAGVHESSVCRILKRVSQAIAELAPAKIIFPEGEAIEQAHNEFFQISGFPRVIGALDCTHIKIQRPSINDAEIFRNRKQFFSLNVQVVSNASMKIIDIVARWPGSAHDATIFNNSNLRARFEMGLYGNSFLLGDSAYPNRNYLMTPLLNPVNQPEQLYNESHIRTRNKVEKLFGIWKRRFPIMAYGCRLKVKNTLTVIVATAVLHNIAREMAEEVPPEEIELNQPNLDILINEQDIPPEQIEHFDDFYDVRRNLIQNYFANL